MFDARVGRPLMVLFLAIICVVLGVIGGGSVILTTVGPYARARDWVSTNATISYLGLEKFKRGGRKSDIVRVRCIYTYIVGGKLYKGVNASVVQSDPFKYYQNYLYKELKAQKDKGTARAYFDLRDPATSALSIKYSPGMFTSGILALTVVVGFGLMWLVSSVVRLKSGMEMVQNSLEVRAEEKEWPPTYIATCILMIALMLFTLPIAIDSVLHGMPLSFVNVAWALIHLIIFIVFARRAYFSRGAGKLVLPADTAATGACCVCIPPTWDGNCLLQLTVSWVVENHLLFLKPVGKFEKLVPISRNIDPASQETHIVFKPAQIPQKLNGCDIIAVKISGNIGDKPYEGTFLVGQLLIWSKYETRETLGLRMMGSQVF